MMKWEAAVVPEVPSIVEAPGVRQRRSWRNGPQ